MKNHKTISEHIREHLANMTDDQKESISIIMENLTNYCEYTKSLKKLSNTEVSNKLVIEVWGKTMLFSREEALIDEAISRLQKIKDKKPKNE